QPAVDLAYLVDARRRRFGVRHVETAYNEGHAGGRSRGEQGFRTIEVAHRRDDAVARLRRGNRGGQADARRAAGDEDGLHDALSASSASTGEAVASRARVAASSSGWMPIADTNENAARIVPPAMVQRAASSTPTGAVSRLTDRPPTRAASGMTPHV